MKIIENNADNAKAAASAYNKRTFRVTCNACESVLSVKGADLNTTHSATIEGSKTVSLRRPCPACGVSSTVRVHF